MARETQDYRNQDCGTCIHWAKNVGSESIGRCRRFPPMIKAAGHDEYVQPITQLTVACVCADYCASIEEYQLRI